jgi:hypothetical protein
MRVSRGSYALTLLWRNSLITLFSVYGDFCQRLDSYPHLITLHTEHRDGNTVSNRQ